MPSLPDSVEDAIDMAAVWMIPMLDAFADIEFSTGGRPLVMLTQEEVEKVAIRLDRGKVEQLKALEAWRG